MERWIYTVEQEGIVVVEGDVPDKETAQREAFHYAMMYAQDGPECLMKIEQDEDNFEPPTVNNEVL